MDIFLMVTARREVLLATSGERPGGCETSYNAQDSPTANDFQPQTSAALRPRKPPCLRVTCVLAQQRHLTQLSSPSSCPFSYLASRTSHFLGFLQPRWSLLNSPTSKHWCVQGSVLGLHPSTILTSVYAFKYLQTYRDLTLHLSPDSEFQVRGC